MDVMGDSNKLNRFNQGQSLRADYDRHKEQGCAALRLLERLRKAAREGETPSTADLQDERIYGLRPVNRIGDLIRGDYGGRRFDIERLDCGHGVYRWRLHEPARPGYPKNKKQEVLPLGDRYNAQTGKPRPGWQSRPFSEERMAQDDCFVLTPPEPRR